MNFFTSELCEIVKHSNIIENPRYVGRDCVFKLSGKISGKIYFDTGGYADHYNILRINLYNKSEGLIDKQTIRLADVFGQTQSPIGMNDPHIWVYNGEAKWYSCKPNVFEYEVLADQIDSYLECFYEPEQTETDDMEM